MSRALPVLFSLFVHGSIVASGFLLSDCGEPPEEKIFSGSPGMMALLCRR